MTTLQQPKIRPSSSRPPQPRRRRDQPVLRFSPYAWAKLLFMRDAGDTEIGGFGITPPGSAPGSPGGGRDLLLVEDFVTVQQTTNPINVRFGDEAVADFFEDQAVLGRRPEQFGRIWCHTHPGDSAQPSGVDEETFDRVFGGCDWAVMFILARGGQTYARLRFNRDPSAEIVIPVEVDYGQAFRGSDHEGWTREYQAHVHPEVHAGWPGMGLAAAADIPEHLLEQLAREELDLLGPVSWEQPHEEDRFEEEREIR